MSGIGRRGYFDPGTDDWFDSEVGDSKVVPADAIVIERIEVPEVRIGVVGELISDCSFTRSPTADPAIIRREALALLAISEYLAAHPPVDQRQVDEVLHVLANATDLHGCSDGWDLPALARRLVEKGVTP